MKGRITLYAGLLIVAYIALAAWRIHDRKYDIWFHGYVQWLNERKPLPETTIHLLVFATDHFEPNYYSERIYRWESGFPALARAHRDYYGRVHQHTWFYPGEQVGEPNLTMLSRLVAQGYGEVELHYHHFFDTYSSFQKRLEDSIALFQRYGFLKTVDGRTKFAFIHGNAGLDNSEGPELCGVSQEIRLLLHEGCYADFTFPELWETAQPSSVNNIYETTDDPGPKSYDHVLPLRGTPSPDRLVIFQGPLLVSMSPNPLRMFFHVEDANLHPASPPSPARADKWVRAAVHVPQRPEWIFIKLWGHGASSDDDIDANLGAPMDRTLSYLEYKYNDGQRYVLHYVTAREAYNVARSAAAGRSGDPRQYYDYEIKPYVADNIRAGYHAADAAPIQ